MLYAHYIILCLTACYVVIDPRHHAVIARTPSLPEAIELIDILSN